MTLDLGPGRNVQPHDDTPVIRLDHRLDVLPTLLSDLRALPFRDNSFSTVYASHVLEHFCARETEGIVREWVRVLRPGGELQIFVPNLEWILLQVTNGICDEFVINALYGRQEYPSDVHRNAFTPTTMKALLQKFPLDDVEVRTFRNSICVWTTKALQS